MVRRSKDALSTQPKRTPDVEEDAPGSLVRSVGKKGQDPFFPGKLLSSWLNPEHVYGPASGEHVFEVIMAFLAGRPSHPACCFLCI